MFNNNMLNISSAHLFPLSLMEAEPSRKALRKNPPDEKRTHKRTLERYKNRIFLKMHFILETYL